MKWKKAKQVVVVAPSLNSQGGIASVVKAYQEAGVFERFPAILIATHAEGSKLRKGWVALRSLLQFTYFLATAQVAVIHVHMARWNSVWRKSLFIALAHCFRRPVLLHLHSGGFFEFYCQDCGPLRQRLVRWLLNRAATVIVLTEASRKAALGLMQHKRVLLIPNFLPAAGDSESVCETKQPRMLLFLGRLTREKGVFDLLAVLPPLVRSYPDLRVVLAGDGERESVRAYIDRLGLTEHVTLPGWLSGEAKAQALAEAQIFVLPSYVEGLPIGVLEAMRSGCALACSAVGGIPDQFDDGVEGLQFEPGNTGALSNALDALLADPDRCQQMGLAGRIRFEQQFAADAVVPQLENIYRHTGASYRVATP